MPRSTTIWAAALVLASFSGSGPLLTTAEAMPAPGPQETQGRPRYYFPRHVKRQIVTNATAPAAPTTSTSKSSTSQQVESRQAFDLSSLLNPIFKPDPVPDTSSDIIVSKSDPITRPTTVTSIKEIIVTPVPDRSDRQPGTGNQRASATPQEEDPEDASSSPARGASSSGVPQVIVTPTPTPEQEAEPTPVRSSTEANKPLLPILGSSGLLPLIPATTPTPTPTVGSSADVQPTPTPSPITELLSTLLGGLVGSTGSPAPVVQPTPAASSAPAELLSTLLGGLVGSTGSPAPVVQPTPVVEPTPAASSAPADLVSTLLGGLVGSTGALAPVLQPTPTGGSASTGLIPEVIVPASSAPAAETPAPVVQPTPAASSAPADLVSTLLGGLVGSTGALAPVLQPTPTGGSASTGLIPEVIVPASSVPAAETPAPSPAPASSFQGPFLVPGSTGAPIPTSVLQPTTSQGGLLGGLLSSVLLPEVGSTGVLPSDVVSPTAGLPLPSSQAPLLVVPSSGGIVVGITTALGTGASPTPTSPALNSGAIPTSESVAPSAPLDLPGALSSLVSGITGGLATGSAGPTAPVTPSPTPVASGVLPPLVSSLAADVSSLLSGVPDVPASVIPSILSSFASEFPSATVPAPLPPASSIVASIISDISSGLIPSGVLPSSGVVPTGVLPSSGIVPTGVSSGTGAVPTPSETPSLGVTPPLPSETPSATPSAGSSGLTPSIPSGTPSGILPSGASGSGVSSGPTVTPTPVQPSSVPASESPASSPSSAAPSSTDIVPPTSGNATISETPTLATPTNSGFTSGSATVPVQSSAQSSAQSTPVVTMTPTPVQSQRPTGTDSATSMVVGTSIVRETTSYAPPSSTASGIPSSLPKMIAPPGGVVSSTDPDSFMGQVCFKWPLNYPFISANDGGNQIFHYLPKAIAYSLNISESEVHNIGLKPLDTTAYQGFITTLALFTIPKDLQGTLAAQLRNPADAFWHNEESTVNDLTALINTACPLPAGKVPGENSPSNQPSNAGTTSNGGPDDGGALGGDTNSSKPINASAAGIATGAIVGAIAYGAAMFFVARRYRNKRIAHQRSSSVPSTGSRMTYGSIPGGAAAWMHGARNGRITPGSRGSQGSSSTQGRSVRTQQISAPVMAENSLGWN
jgi:hypothetical protein